MINKDSHTEMKVNRMLDSWSLQFSAAPSAITLMTWPTILLSMRYTSIPRVKWVKEAFETEDKDTAFYSNERYTFKINFQFTWKEKVRRAIELQDASMRRELCEAGSSGANCCVQKRMLQMMRRLVSIIMFCSQLTNWSWGNKISICFQTCFWYCSLL
jgi:hypothetical protein